jgi:vacuolar-type H+-ATPase subunit C/Vma6
MLYSHNQENEKLKLFTIFLNQAANGNNKYANVVNSVIQETHQFAMGQKSLYNVNRDSINIIILMSALDKNYLEGLVDNPQEYGQQTYSKVLEIISKQQQTPIF